MRVNQLNGLLAVDKPAGYTSNEVASYIRKYMTYLLHCDLFDLKKRKNPPGDIPTVEKDMVPIDSPDHYTKANGGKKKYIKWPPEAKAGQAGTLDPMATGVLVIGLGSATKSLHYFLKGGSKTYIASGKFGTSTDSFDSSGKTIDTKDYSHVTRKDIESTLVSQFSGSILQTPPIFSALKVNGQKLCDIARKNEKDGVENNVEIKPREVTIFNIELLSFEKDEFSVRVECSSGTYIRSIIHDLGKSLNTVAHMTALQRSAQGPFMMASNPKFDNESSIPVLSVSDMTNYDTLISYLTNPEYKEKINKYTERVKTEMAQESSVGSKRKVDDSESAAADDQKKARLVEEEER